jgi:hypothetical protein
MSSTVLEQIQKAKEQVKSSTKSALVFPEDLRASPYYMIFTPIKYSKKDTLGDIALAEVTSTAEDRRFDISQFGTTFSGQLRGSRPTTPTFQVNYESGQLIALPLPSQLNDNLSMAFNTTDMGLTAAGFQAGQAIGNMNFGLDATIDTVSYAARVMSTLSDGINTALNLLAGNVPNPYSILSFKNVEQRSFEFDWVFVPRNEKESLMIRDIINTIRYLALPDQNGVFLEFPYEWEVQFVGTKFLHSFSRGYVTDLKVEYGSSGGISFFKMADGDSAPSQVKFSFTFKEIYPLNKTLILPKEENVERNPSIEPNIDFVSRLNFREAALLPLGILEDIETRRLEAAGAAPSLNESAKKANEAVGYVPKVGGFT